MVFLDFYHYKSPICHIKCLIKLSQVLRKSGNHRKYTDLDYTHIQASARSFVSRRQSGTDSERCGQLINFLTLYFYCIVEKKNFKINVIVSFVFLIFFFRTSHVVKKLQ